MQYWWLVSKHREGAAKHTHTLIHRQANTHLLRDFISSALCRADAGACQAISCLRWFSLSPLRREQLGPSGFGRQRQNVWTRASKIYMCRCACVCVCVVRQWAIFPAPIMLPERGKRKKRALPKNAKPWHPPPLSLGITKHTNSSRQRGGNCCTFSCKTNLLFLLPSSNINTTLCHKLQP